VTVLSPHPPFLFCGFKTPPFRVSLSPPLPFLRSCNAVAHVQPFAFGGPDKKNTSFSSLPNFLRPVWVVGFFRFPPLPLRSAGPILLSHASGSVQSLWTFRGPLPTSPLYGPSMQKPHVFSPSFELCPILHPRYRLLPPSFSPNVFTPIFSFVLSHCDLWNLQVPPPVLADPL